MMRSRKTKGYDLIRVSAEVKEILFIIKEANGYKSYNEAVKHLIVKIDKGDGNDRRN